MRGILLAFLLLLGSVQAQGAAHAQNLPRKLLMVYADSWRENRALVANDTALAHVPGYINLVALSFARPDMDYRGNLDLTGTGFDYKFSGQLLRDAITRLKTAHPATKVILSVGSAAFMGWDHLHAQAIAQLVHDLNADGVDIDYEPETQCALGTDGHVACTTDAMQISIVKQLRHALPRPLILSIAGWHVGAYGEGEFQHSPPDFAPHAGFMLATLRDAKAAAALDLVSIDAYDAGTTYDPMQAYRAYRAAWKGKLALGVEVPMKGATGPFYTVRWVEKLAKQVSGDPLGGMMVYSMLEPPYPPPATADHPSGAMLEQAACRGMGMTGCDAPAPPPGH